MFLLRLLWNAPVFTSFLWLWYNFDLKCHICLTDFLNLLRICCDAAILTITQCLQIEMEFVIFMYLFVLFENITNKQLNTVRPLWWHIFVQNSFSTKLFLTKSARSKHKKLLNPAKWTFSTVFLGSKLWMQKISKSWVSPFISALGCYFAIAAFICTMKLDVGIPTINFTLIDILGDFSNSFPKGVDAKIYAKSIPREPSG